MWKRVANAPFLACLSSDLGGVWLFRIRCFIFAFVQAWLRHGFCPPTAAIYFSYRGFQRCPFGTVWKGCERAVFGLPELGFRWCLAVSDPLPTSYFCLCPGLVASRFLSTYCGHLLLLRGFQRCPFGTVWKGCERAVFGLPELGFIGGVWLFRIRCRRASFLPLSRLGCVTVFCPPTAAFYFSLEGFKGALSAACGRVANAPFLACLSSDFGGVWLFRIRCRRASFSPLSRLGCVTVFVHLLRPFILLLRGFQRCPFGTVWKGCERAVFGLPELGFRWCLAVSDPLPTSFIFAFVHGFCPPTAAIYFSLEVPFRRRVEELRTRRFLACLSSDLGGVWLFRIRCRRASFLPLSRLGCVTVFVHLLRPFTSP